VPTYDDQKSDTDKKFDDLVGRNFKPGEADQIEAGARDAEQQRVDNEFNNIVGGESSGADSSKSDGNTQAADKSELRGKETDGAQDGKQSGDASQPSSDDQDDGAKKTGFRGWSRRKKVGVGLTSILLGGGATGFGFLMLLSPIAKVETVMNSIDSFYGAANESAIDTATQNALNGYLVKKVFPNLGRGNCHTTRDAACTATASDASNPIGALYNAWKEDRIEQKLANNYGLVFGRKGGGNGTLYINVNGRDIDLKNGGNIWDSADTKASTKNEIRNAIKTNFKEASLYDRYYTRYKVGKLVEQKYGVKRCTFKCDLRDNFSDNVDTKKKAAKALLIRRVIGPFSENTALALTCVMDGSCNLEPDNSHDITDDNQVERRSDFSSKVQSQVNKFALEYGSDKLADLSKQVDAMGDDGVMKYAMRATLSKVLGKEISGEAIDKVATPIGWINFAAQIINFVDTAGPKMQKISFALSTTMAVQTYMMYVTAGNEARAGQTDMTQFGSLSDSLTTASVDDEGDSSDMTATPMYQEIINRGTTSTDSSVASLFNPQAYAATSTKYTCNDNKELPAGQKVCPEEVVNGGNSYATALTEGAQTIPGWGALSNVAHVWTSIVGKAFGAIGDVAGAALSLLPGWDNLMNTVAGWVTPLFTWVAKSVIPNLLGSLTGGRLVDVLMIGANTTYNVSAGTQLGAGRVSDEDIAQVRTAYLDQQEQEFQSKSLYARIFDTESPHSLVTQMAAAMPTTNNFASSFGKLASNPFGHLSTAIFSAFTPSRAFAAVSAQPDPFGVPQLAVLPQDIPENVDDTWWNQNCPADYVQKFLDSQTEDPTTGMMVASETDPCFIYKTVSQVAGGKSDPKLLPKDTTSTTQTDAAAGSGDLSLVSGDTMSLAKQIMDKANDPNGSIKFQTPANKSAFQRVVDTGHAANCGGPAISSKLLGVILTLSKSYKLVLGVFVDGHDCDSGNHPKGAAVDINGVNPLNGGSGGTGNQLHFESASMPIIREFYQRAGEVLAASGGGGLGQYGTYDGRQCFAGTLPPKVQGVAYFPDSCTHLHMDTRGK